MRSLPACLACVVVLPIALACGSDPPEPAQVIIESTVDPGANGQAKCQIASTPWIGIGDYGNVNANPSIAPTAIKNDDAYNGQKVNVTCSVTRTGDTFRVIASGQINGTEGGAVTVTGDFSASGVQSNLELTFSRADYGTFKGVNCVAEYNSGPGVMLGYEPLMGVAAGRVWARATCDKITKNDQGEERACRGIVTFRFENCTQ